MSSFNRVILVGRLTRDPEIRYTPSGTQLAKFGLAVDRPMSKTDETDFFNVVAWQKLAEICGQYLKKGRLVLIEGEIQTRTYETQDGQKRHAFEIVARNMQMLGGRSDGEGGGGKASAQEGTVRKQSADFDELSLDEVDVDEFDAEEMPF